MLYSLWRSGYFKVIQKGNTQRDTLNKIIYVIVQSAFLTNKKKRLVRCTVSEWSYLVWTTCPTRAPVLGDEGAWNDFHECSTCVWIQVWIRMCVCLCVCVYLLLYSTAVCGRRWNVTWENGRDTGMKAKRWGIKERREKRWRQKVAEGLSWCRSGPQVAEEASCFPCKSWAFAAPAAPSGYCRSSATWPAESLHACQPGSRAMETVMSWDWYTLYSCSTCFSS